MRPKQGRRVNGPYPSWKKFRLVIIEEDGSQRAESYDTKELAEEAKRRLTADTSGPTVWEAMTRYFDHLGEKGCKPASVKTARFRLQSFFGFDEPECDLEYLPVTQLTRERCEALYAEQRTRMAVDTHRNTLTKAKAFGQWCVKQRFIGVNPLAEIEPIGRRKRGKEQLRVDEARKFLAVCQEHTAEGDPAAVAAMTALLLGLRGSEVVERVVRDLDDGGRLLWIPSAKTEAGKRTLEVPDSLRPALLKLAKGKQPSEKLFTDRDRHWLLYHVRRMCREAGVPEVTAHSLRGLHATLAMEWGSTGRVVAAALGHTSFAMTTKRHYVAPGTVERAAQRRVGSMLEQRPEQHDQQEEGQDAPARPASRPTFGVIDGGLSRREKIASENQENL